MTTLSVVHLWSCAAGSNGNFADQRSEGALMREYLRRKYIQICSQTDPVATQGILDRKGSYESKPCNAVSHTVMTPAGGSERFQLPGGATAQDLLDPDLGCHI